MRKQGAQVRRNKKSRPLRFFIAMCLCVATVGALTALITEFFSGSAESVAETVVESEDVSVKGMVLDTQSSGYVLHEQGVATAEGTGRIPEDTAQGRLLGRRAALTDARRNLLILRQKLLRGKFDARSVSGKIAEVRIHSEKMDGGLYFLKVDVPLNRLMKGDVPIE